MRYLFVILPFLLTAQPHPSQILPLFDQPTTLIDIYNETGVTVAPWLSWRYIPNQSIAINVLCSWQELQVILADKWILSHDLWILWSEAGIENMELIKRGNRVQIQRPGQFFPMPKYYTIQKSTETLQLPLGENGWYGRFVNGGVFGQVKLPVVIKQVDSEYILSAAIIMRQTSY